MHPRHIEEAAIVMYMYLYSLAFMDLPCTLGATVTKCRTVNLILSPGHVEYEPGLLMVRKFLDPSGIRTHDIPLESRVR